MDDFVSRESTQIREFSIEFVVDFGRYETADSHNGIFARMTSAAVVDFLAARALGAEEFTGFEPEGPAFRSPHTRFGDGHQGPNLSALSAPFGAPCPTT